MKISKKDWNNYIARLRKINDKAADKVASYMGKIDISTAEGMSALLDYSYAVATRYGEAATELACQMYDAVALVNKAAVPAAEPAATATYGEVAKAVRGKMFDTREPSAVGSAVGRLVKMAGVDTTMQNALRDGAEWAWIPSGDTCAFCLTLASRGWQKASKQAIRGGHAEHIHNNCDCTYAIRFDGVSEVEGYDPDALYDDYMSASDGSPLDKINALRRQHYAANRASINAQKRAAYARRVERQRYFGKTKSISVDMEHVNSQGYRDHFKGMTKNAKVDDAACNYSRQILKHRSGTYKEDLVLIDADTGKHILTINKDGADNSVSYDEHANARIDKARAEGHRIMAIHNHPNSLPPTLDDGVSALERGYDVGIVVCHDGTVYTYSPAAFTLSERECEDIHNAISYQIKTGAEMDEVWYNMLKEYGMTIQKR